MVDYKLPESMRDELKEPFGQVLRGDTPILSKFQEMVGERAIVTVGDVTTFNVLKLGYHPRIAIIDGTTKRGDFKESGKLLKEFMEDGYTDMVAVENPAGMMTAELCHAIEEAAGNLTSTIIAVDGEEDLALIPCMIAVPMKIKDAVLLYGQPDIGMVVVHPTPELRRRCIELTQQCDKVLPEQKFVESKLDAFAKDAGLDH